MPSAKKWDDEEQSYAGSDASGPAVPAGAARRNKFEDEEEDDDVLESWDAAEDSEVEREKEKKATQAKAQAEAEAAAKKKSKAERIAEHKAARAKAGLEDDESDEETEAERRRRLKAAEKEADLSHAEDLFGGVGTQMAGRKTTAGKTIVSIDSADPSKTVDLATLPAFNPITKLQFEQMRSTLVPLITASEKKAQYGLFLTEFSKQLAGGLPSEQIKKIASSLTALGNEKMKQEKAAEKTGKKSKAQKTKTSLVANRDNAMDTKNYDEEEFGDDDFM